MAFEKAAGGAIVRRRAAAGPKGRAQRLAQILLEAVAKKTWGQKRKNSRSVLAPADELDDLVVVARFHRRFGPCEAWKYF